MFLEFFHEYSADEYVFVDFIAETQQRQRDEEERKAGTTLD